MPGGHLLQFDIPDAGDGVGIDEHTVATWLKMWYELYAKPNVRTASAYR